MPLPIPFHKAMLQKLKNSCLKLLLFLKTIAVFKNTFCFCRTLRGSTGHHGLLKHSKRYVLEMFEFVLTKLPLQNDGSAHILHLNYCFKSLNLLKAQKW